MPQNNDSGCCADTHGKVFEIILIIGFLIGIASLTVNLILTLWCFKYSLYLLIIEIAILAFNAICFILTIILRIWRSDGSVFYKNFLSSNCVSIFILLLVIMNFILTIVEITLFWIVIAFLELHNITYSVSNNFNINADNGNNALEEPYNSGDNFYKILNNLDNNNFNKLNGAFS